MMLRDENTQKANTPHKSSIIIITSASFLADVVREGVCLFTSTFIPDKSESPFLSPDPILIYGRQEDACNNEDRHWYYKCCNKLRNYPNGTHNN